ncbi:hypothetical protein R1sor_016337 [Riccia sorocarpa]|uniref:Uncharacterized protein n=1 Tax=Riccia sorocarpa TaxID=122646 RepID=A0ABD3HF46_9MARC
MIYTTPWEPGFDTTKVLSKNMSCWPDIQNVDPMLAGEGVNMLSTTGEVLRTAGMTKEGDGKGGEEQGTITNRQTGRRRGEPSVNAPT